MQKQITTVDTDLWVVNDKFTLPKGFLPFALPPLLGRCSVRMTVVRLSSGGLLLHSPVEFSDSLAERLQQIGPIEFIVGPSVMHNTYLVAWHERFPKSTCVVAPKTFKRNPQLTNYPTFSDELPVAPSDLKQQLMSGHRSYETLFLHPKTKTLIVTDLAYSIFPKADLIEKIWLKSAGVRNPLGVTSYNKKKITDAALFRSCLDKVLSWDFDRLIMSHGQIMEKGAKAAFAEIWSSIGR